MNKLTILFIIFILVGIYLIILKNDIDLHKKEGRTTFVYKFSSWIWNVCKSTANVVGYAIGQDWLPQDPGTNETIG